MVDSIARAPVLRHPKMPRVPSVSITDSMPENGGVGQRNLTSNLLIHSVNMTISTSLESHESCRAVPVAHDTVSANYHAR